LPKMVVITGYPMLIRIVSALAIVLLNTPAVSAQNQVEVAGKVFSLQGSASVNRAGQSMPLSEGMELASGDELVVGEPGRVAVELLDGSYVRLASGSRMKLPGKEKPLGLIEGALHFLSHSEQHPTVETQQVTAAIRGTEFQIATDSQETTISMFSGSVDGQSASGRAQLSAGQGARFRKGKAPEIFAVLKNERSVQWSMFVPFTEQAGDDTRATDLFRAGKTREALRSLGKESSGECDPRSVLKGRMLVSSGDPASGAAILERCVASDKPERAKSAAAAALSSVKLMRGDSASAEKLATLARDGDPTSTSARIAHSYALQERGDLEGALAVIEEDPNGASSDLKARRAELLFMFGRVPEAREILSSISNRSWYAETVYGFVLMADRSFSDAEEAFTRAATAEPGAGLPRLGLGIIRVNRGELAAARKDFERATVLEPQRGLYRSYLGKDYFEDDLYDKADPEYARAIELDPNDPTPYLYRSFMRVAENDLVGALEDIGKARELADARDVYRSKLLLDQDSAMRSASVGRVYQQLGFKERGRVEAITAISQDYQNATAHRLLSQTQEDIFAADTIASEQRMSNLFSPLSINVVDSIGTGVSLNEYSQLFERDGWRTSVNSQFDSKSDQFRSGVLSAYKNENVVLGLSADGSGYNGVADDPRTSAGRVGASFQAQPTWGDRFVMEGRGTFTGDTDLEQSTDIMNGTFNAAYLRKFSPEVTALINSSYDRSRLTNHQFDYLADIGVTSIDAGTQSTFFEQFPFEDRSKRYETTVVNEAQLIANQGRVNSILTFRNATSTLDNFDNGTATLDPDSETTLDFNSAGSTRLNGNSLSYLGAVSVGGGLSVNLGAEYETLQWADRDEPPFTDDRSRDHLASPKAGFVFRPDETMALRAGYGESLGKGTRADLISLEPTLIGGITQRYNDLPGTKAQNLGLGADFHPDESTFFGSEWTRRWLDMSQAVSLYNIVDNQDSGDFYTDVATADNYQVPVGQDFVSAYVYRVLDRRWVAGTDYRFVNQQTNGDVEATLRDQRGTAFTRYFFSDGFFVQGSGTYRYQTRDNVSADNGESPNGSDNAFLFGAGIGYRIPKRHGLISLDVQNIFGQDINLSQTSYFNEPVFNDPTVRLAANFNF
jgi:Flp pilus assembly protein TadD